VRHKLYASTLLALSLVLPGAYAQSAPTATAQPAENLVDPASIEALKNMGAHLQTLKRFQVSTELTGERVLADGQKLQHTAAADLDVERPNKLRARMYSSVPNAKSSMTASTPRSTPLRNSITRRSNSQAPWAN